MTTPPAFSTNETTQQARRDILRLLESVSTACIDLMVAELARIDTYYRRSEARRYW